MSAFTEFFLSCSAVALLVGLAIALLCYFGRRGRDTRSDRDIIAALKNKPVAQRIAALNDKSPRMRACAAAALAETNDEPAESALINALEDPDAEVVSTVFKALAENGSARASDALLDKLMRDDSIPYRPGLLPEAAVRRRDDVVDWLITRVERGDPGALTAVGEYPTPGSAEFLIALLRNDDIPLWDRKRREAAESLARIYWSDGLGRIHKRLIEKLEEPVWFNPRAMIQGSPEGETGLDAKPTEVMKMAEFLAQSAARKRDPAVHET